MSYSRFGDNSDIFLYMCGDWEYYCQWCLLERSKTGDESAGYLTKSLDEIVNHLKEHIKVGHLVPKNLIQNIIDDRPIVEKEIDDEIKEERYPNW